MLTALVSFCIVACCVLKVQLRDDHMERDDWNQGYKDDEARQDCSLPLSVVLYRMLAAAVLQQAIRQWIQSKGGRI